MSVRVACGEAYFDKLPWYKSSRLSKATRDRELGPLVVVESRSTPHPRATVDVFHPKVPCQVSVGTAGWDTAEETERRARAIAKDVLARLTPASIARPRAELVVNRYDMTEAEMRAELARWPAKAKAVAGFAPLAPGYPKIVRSEEYPGLPPGKQFLLYAICRSSRGSQLSLALPAVLPDLAQPKHDHYTLTMYSVDGLGLPEHCPPNIDDDPRASHVENRQWSLPDGRFVTIGVLGTPHATAPGEVRARAGVFLYAQDGAVLDSLSIEFRTPHPRAGRGPFASRSRVTYSECSAGLHFEAELSPRVLFLCRADWDDQICSKPEQEEWTYLVETTDSGKLDVKTESRRYPGSLCRPNEGEED